VKFPFRKKPAPHDFTDFLSSDKQIEIAMEQGFSVALEIVAYHYEIWDEVVSSLANLGAEISLSEETYADLDRLGNRLAAILLVLGENTNTPKETIERLMSHVRTNRTNP